jgi:CRISPR-associated endonuclease Csn1
MARIWGLDIGSTSIGWAVINYNSAQGIGEILRQGIGCRIFPETRDPDGTPLNQNRRQKRMARRQLRRRRNRRRALNECLAEANLLPPFYSHPARGKNEEANAWHIVMRSDPIELRRRGLDEKLDPYELGRALYHLAQRRHFKGRDLEEDEDGLNGETIAQGKGKKEKNRRAENDSEQSADELVAKASRDSTLAILRTSGQTLGQFLYTKAADGRQRGVHANRSVVLDEFDRLCDTQAAYHIVLRDPAFRERLKDVIFTQRPVFWRKNTLGECRFMPGEDLCPKGSWLSQQRRMLEKVNNLALVGGNARPLDAEERAAILAKLQTQASMSWGAVRTTLKPLYKARGEAGAERSLKFNLELDEGGTLLGNPLETKLAGFFGDQWTHHPHRQDIRDAIHKRLWTADYGEVGKQRVVILPQQERKQRRAEVAQSFITDFGVTTEQAAALRELKLPTGWEPFSTAALQHFMPHLEKGVRFGALVNGPEWQKWREETFPNRIQPTGEILDRLPSPTKKYPEEMKRIASLRNPTVVRVQNELRKVVNNLLAVYGKPDLIRVELAREVGKSKREREEMQAGQRRQEKRRRDAATDLRSKGIEPSRSDIEKWMLWKECGEFDPYSGRPICFDDLFGKNEFDVEHIWPRAKCFDDSYANKTLCLKALNARKTNRTPFEAFGNDPDEWPRMKDRVWSLVKDGKMTRGKAKRFCREEPLDNDFATRQLNDTSFAARQAVTFLKRLWPDVGVEAPVTVQVVTGRVTAQLRRLWGLNNILSTDGEKTRADHRHHAVDALVAACTDPGITQRLSRYWQAKDDPSALPPKLDAPWPTIREDAERAVAGIVVSHRVRKKVSGPLHDEMPWGYTGRDVVKDGKTFGIYVRRMPIEKLALETLKINNVEDTSRNAKFVVRDEAARRALLTHLEAAGVPSAKAYPPYPCITPDGPEIRKVRVVTVQQKTLMAPVSKVGDRSAGRERQPLGFADPANNHHIAIYKLPNGKADYEVVSLFEASNRLTKREPIVRRKRDDGAAFIMSLAPGDTVEFPDGDKKGYWIVQGAWANGQVVLERANDAAHATTTRPAPTALLKANVRKTSVDPIGRVRPASD